MVKHSFSDVHFGMVKKQSFIWLLTKLLDAMPKGAPQVILTDQDPMMTKAISQNLPFTVHPLLYLAYFEQIFSED